MAKSQIEVEIEYSDKYNDDWYEYRHVIVPLKLYPYLSKRNRTYLTSEWRSIGITLSRGWINYMLYEAEPHVFIFKRPLGTDPLTGKQPAGWCPPDWETESYFLKMRPTNTPVMVEKKNVLSVSEEKSEITPLSKINNPDIRPPSPVKEKKMIQSTKNEIKEKTQTLEIKTNLINTIGTGTHAMAVELPQTAIPNYPIQRCIPSIEIRQRDVVKKNYQVRKK